MQQPLINVNGESFKVASIHFHEEGEIAHVSYFGGDEIAFRNHATGRWSDVNGKSMEVELITEGSLQNA